MNDTLKVAGRIGAELGAAKAENDRLRGLLRELREITSEYARDADLESRVDAAISQQAEPLEPATAQDEREAPTVEEPTIVAYGDPKAFKNLRIDGHKGAPYNHEWMWAAAAPGLVPMIELDQHKRIVAALTRPAQTEQQPVGYQFQDREGVWKQFMSEKHYEDTLADGTWPIRAIYAAPIAQTAPQGKFRMGDLVKKSTGSEWVGRVVGWYSTEQTKEGYAVESSAHRNSVQIYPAKALEAVE